MTPAADSIRKAKHFTDGLWPAQAREVSHIGNACVVEGIGDFNLDDLDLVRRRFPDRLVTLDGDVITVWPPPSATG
ncbi:hypothetical protein [Streptomyces griseorubiginosus]|uniref:hypothetical protein n=1 Tax=Streptomyces griseorubiginosus TaxID=67304 RepID=UPI000B1A105F|nr:hypothetical protein [Streptomyces griseorubiginosus]